MEKLIITAALTGAVTMPAQTPHLPITPQQLADEAVRAAEAGAASVHIHARNPKDGMPTSDLEVYSEIVSKIKQRSNVIVCITTGGAVGADAEKRIAVVPRFRPELASFNMGSINFSIHPIAERYRDEDYKYPWEKGFILGTKENVFRNTFSDIEYFCQTMKQNGTRPECEAYDVGHIYNIAYLVRQKLLRLPKLPNRSDPQPRSKLSRRSPLRQLPRRWKSLGLQHLPALLLPPPISRTNQQFQPAVNRPPFPDQPVSHLLRIAG